MPLTVDQPPQTRYHHPEFTDDIGVPPGRGRSMGLDEGIRTGPHMPRAPRLPSSPQPPTTAGLVTVPLVLPFPGYPTAGVLLRLSLVTCI